MITKDRNKRKIEENTSSLDVSNEIEINQINCEIVAQIMLERVGTYGYARHSDILRDSISKCESITGHASPQKIRECITRLTDEDTEFAIIKDENNVKFIIQRMETEETDEIRKGQKNIIKECIIFEKEFSQLKKEFESEKERMRMHLLSDEMDANGHKW